MSFSEATHGLGWGTEVLGFRVTVGLSLQLGFHLSGGGGMGQQNEGVSAVLQYCWAARRGGSSRARMNRWLCEH